MEAVKKTARKEDRGKATTFIHELENKMVIFFMNEYILNFTHSLKYLEQKSAKLIYSYIFSLNIASIGGLGGLCCKFYVTISKTITPNIM